MQHQKETIKSNQSGMSLWPTVYISETDVLSNANIVCRSVC